MREFLSIFSVHKFQTDQRRVHAERVERRLQACYRIGHYHGVLLGPYLILKRSFDVGMNQELDPRSKAITVRVQRAEERRAGAERQAVDPVGARD